MTVEDIESKTQSNTAQTVRTLLFDVEPTLFSSSTRGDRSFQELKLLYIQAKKQYMDIVNNNVFDQQEHEYANESKLRIESLWDSLLTHLLEGLSETQMLCEIASGKLSAKQKGVFKKKKEEEYISGKFQNSKKSYKLCLEEGKDILQLAGIQDKTSSKIRSSTQTSVSDENTENSDRREAKQKQTQEERRKEQKSKRRQNEINDENAIRQINSGLENNFKKGKSQDLNDRETQQSKSPAKKQDAKEAKEANSTQKGKRQKDNKAAQKGQNKVKVNKIDESVKLPGNKNKKLEIIKETSMDVDSSNTKFSDGETPKGDAESGSTKQRGLFTKQKSNRGSLKKDNQPGLDLGPSASNKLTTIQQSDVEPDSTKEDKLKSIYSDQNLSQGSAQKVSDPQQDETPMDQTSPTQPPQLSTREFQADGQASGRNQKKMFNFLKRPSPSARRNSEAEVETPAELEAAQSRGVKVSGQDQYVWKEEEEPQVQEDDIDQQLSQKNQATFNIFPDKNKLSSSLKSTKAQIQKSASNVVTARKEPVDTANQMVEAFEAPEDPSTCQVRADEKVTSAAKNAPQKKNTNPVKQMQGMFSNFKTSDVANRSNDQTSSSRDVNPRQLQEEGQGFQKQGDVTEDQILESSQNLETQSYADNSQGGVPSQDGQNNRKIGIGRSITGFKQSIKSSIKYGEQQGLNLRNGFSRSVKERDGSSNDQNGPDRSLQTDIQHARGGQDYESPAKGGFDPKRNLDKIMTQGRKMNTFVANKLNSINHSQGVPADQGQQSMLNREDNQATPQQNTNLEQSSQNGQTTQVPKAKSNFLQEMQEKKMTQQFEDIDKQLMDDFEKEHDVEYSVSQVGDLGQSPSRKRSQTDPKDSNHDSQSDKIKTQQTTNTSKDLNTDKYVSEEEGQEVPAGDDKLGDRNLDPDQDRSNGAATGNRDIQMDKPQKSVRISEGDSSEQPKPAYAVSGNTGAWNNSNSMKNGEVLKNGSTSSRRLKSESVNKTEPETREIVQPLLQDASEKVPERQTEDRSARNADSSQPQPQKMMAKQQSSTEYANSFFSQIFRDLDSNQDERILSAIGQLQVRCIDRPDATCKKGLIKMGVIKKLTRQSMLSYPNSQVQQANIEFLINLVKSDVDIKKYVVDTIKDQQIRQLLTQKNEEQLNIGLNFLLQLALPSSKNWQLSMMFANQVQLKSFTLIHTLTSQSRNPQIVSKASRMISCILPIKKVFQQEILQEAVLSNFIAVLERTESPDVVKNVCQSLGYAFHNPQNRLMIEILNGYKPYVLTRFVKSVIMQLDRYRDKSEYGNIRATIAYLLTGIAISLPDLKSDILTYQGMQLMLNLASKVQEKESSTQAIKCIAVCIKGEAEVQDSFIKLNGISYMAKILQNSQDKRSTYEEYKIQIQQILAFLQGSPVVQRQMNDSGIAKFLMPNQNQPHNYQQPLRR